MHFVSPDEKLAMDKRREELYKMQLDVQERINPEYFMIVCDQGFMPLHDVKKQIAMFGTKIMPEFMG